MCVHVCVCWSGEDSTTVTQEWVIFSHLLEHVFKGAYISCQCPGKYVLSVLSY